MTSILLTSTPIHGHVTPLLAVAEALVAAGARVRFLTGSRYRDRVRATGADFLPLPLDADYDDRDMDAAFPGRRGLTGPRAIRHDMVEIFLKPVPAQLRAVRAAIGAEPTDAILAEPMFAAGSVLSGIPRTERPLLVALGILPLALKHPDVAPYGLGVRPLPGVLGRLRNALLTTTAERGVFAPVQRFANEISRAETGRELPRFFLDWPGGADLLIQFGVPEFEYPRVGLPDSVHFVGPVARARASTVGVPDWWDDLQNRRVVHVTQGTVANADWVLVEATARALAHDDVIVVVSTGGRPLESLPAGLPDNVRAAEYLPYDRLLPLTDVFVTNGGYGGVQYALEHGVPIVTAGRTEDKAEVGARVELAGVGVDLRTDAPAAKRLGRAVHRLLDDRASRDRARAIGAAIQRSPGPSAIHGLIAAALPAECAATRTHKMTYRAPGTRPAREQQGE